MIRNISGHTNAIHVGQAAAAPNMKQTTVDGVGVKFGKLTDAGRHVVLDGRTLGQDGEDIHLTLDPSTDVRIETDNGKSIHASGNKLLINDKLVKFPGAQPAEAAPASRDRSPAKALAALEKRFPGVKFGGDPAMAKFIKIDKGVKIAPGARIELEPGLEITGQSNIRATAAIQGGKIHNSDIKGVVYDGELDDVSMDVSNRVHGGQLNKVAMTGHAVVTGGEINECTLADSARVAGGVIEESLLGGNVLFKNAVATDMTFRGDAVVTGGAFEGWQMSSGKISGGVHIGGENRGWNEAAGRNEPTNQYSPYINQTYLNSAQYGAQPQQMMTPDYNSMMNAYNPQMMGYQQMNPYGGYQMPNTLYGNPGIVAQQSPWSGLGTGALLGLGAGALLGMGMGGFGMGMYGLGMGGMGLGWGGMGMGMMGMGMMGMGGWGSGLGFGGLYW